MAIDVLETNGYEAEVLGEHNSITRYFATISNTRRI